MAPLFLGYAGEAGTVIAGLLEHYRFMAGSGVAFVVVENSSVSPSRSPAAVAAELRADTDDCIEGLARLASTMKEEGAWPVSQIDHGGRYARAAPNRWRRRRWSMPGGCPGRSRPPNSRASPASSPNSA